MTYLFVFKYHILQNRYDSRDVYVLFTSNCRDTASGFSCCIVGKKIYDDGDKEVTTAPSTSTTEIIPGPGG